MCFKNTFCLMSLCKELETKINFVSLLRKTVSYKPLTVSPAVIPEHNFVKQELAYHLGVF